VAAGVNGFGGAGGGWGGTTMGGGGLRGGVGGKRGGVRGWGGGNGGGIVVIWGRVRGGGGGGRWGWGGLGKHYQDNTGPQWYNEGGGEAGFIGVPSGRTIGAKSKKNLGWIKFFMDSLL